jgi:hypothetical protein
MNNARKAHALGHSSGSNRGFYRSESSRKIHHERILKGPDPIIGMTSLESLIKKTPFYMECEKCGPGPLIFTAELGTPQRWVLENPCGVPASAVCPSFQFLPNRCHPA